MESGTESEGVGSIVWVRRKNGTWWPGKILATEDLPASLIASPRTGSPVKLLGRDDARVDWYNLEKSKRVKAFRCGEFDDCIERAKSLQGMLSKRRERYNRREDAILHALELEKELLRIKGKLHRPFDARTRSSGSAKMDSGGSYLRNGRPSMLTSIKGETMSSSIHFAKEQVGNEPSSENDHTKIMPRMRRLRDLELKSTCVKQELASNGVLYVDDTQSPSSRVSSMGRIMHINGGEPMGRDSQAKRSSCMYLPPESFDVLDYRKTPPSQIEISPSHFSGCDSYPSPNYFIGGKIREFMEVVESGYSESSSSESESESESCSSETEPDMHEDITSPSGATERMDARSSACQRPDALAGEGLPWENHAAATRYDEDNEWHFDRCGKRRSMLIDVNLKVEASDEKEHVPIISLKRKLNGKAIVGHPIQIEVIGESSIRQGWIK